MSEALHILDNRQEKQMMDHFTKVVQITYVPRILDNMLSKTVPGQNVITCINDTDVIVIHLYHVRELCLVTLGRFS